MYQLSGIVYCVVGLSAGSLICIAGKHAELQIKTETALAVGACFPTLIEKEFFTHLQRSSKLNGNGVLHLGCVANCSQLW